MNQLNDVNAQLAQLMDDLREQQEDCQRIQGELDEAKNALAAKQAELAQVTEDR